MLPPRIEALETRIAPAAIFTYTDVDGDRVTIKSSKGTNAQLALAVRSAAVGQGLQLQELDLSGSGPDVFGGADVSILVTTVGPQGDGRVNVGYIDASATNGGLAMGDGSNLALGKVVVGGDIGQIDVGSGPNGVALVSLTAMSIGGFSLGTQGTNSSLASTFTGTIGSINISGSVISGELSFDARVTSFKAGQFLDADFLGTGSFGSLSVVGSVESRGASVLNMTAADKIKIGGSIRTSVGGAPTTLNITNTLKQITVGGGVDGVIRAGKAGIMKITGDLTGPESDNGGFIDISGSADQISIGGSLLGRIRDYTGAIRVGTNLGKLAVGGSLIGAGGAMDVDYEHSAAIQIGGNLGVATIRGGIRGPGVNSGQDLVSCGSIEVGGDVTSLTIGGSLQVDGVGTLSSTKNVGHLSARHFGSLIIGGSVLGESTMSIGIHALGGDSKPAFGTLKIGGNVYFGDIYAGIREQTAGTPKNADGSYGNVTILGNFTASTLGAGLMAMGTTDDVNLVARIASIRIAGNLVSTSTIQAEQIDAVTLGTTKLKLTPGPRNDLTGFSFPPASGLIKEIM